LAAISALVIARGRSQQVRRSLRFAETGMRQLVKLDYRSELNAEALALFVRFWLTANPALPDAARAAAQAQGKERFEGFIEALARKMEFGPKLSDSIAAPNS
jgi:hypothetical protein